MAQVVATRRVATTSGPSHSSSLTARSISSGALARRSSSFIRGPNGDMPGWCRSSRGEVHARSKTDWLGRSSDPIEENPMVEINEENYDDFISQQGDRLTVVDFHAEWCKPCQKISPMVKKLARKHKNVAFASYVVDKSRPSHPKSLGLTSFPTFFMYKSGQKIGMLKGSTCVGELMSIVGSHDSMQV